MTDEIVIPHKYCSKCGVDKPLTEFHKRSSQPDGRKTFCKVCALADSTRYREENQEQIRQRKHGFYLRNKEQINRHNSEYYYRDHEAHKARERTYWRTHREKRLEAAHLRYQAHREEVLAHCRLYYVQNAERIKRRVHLWYSTHPEQVRAARRRWCALNLQRINAYSRARRAREQNAPGHHTDTDVELQYRSQRGCCWHCGKELTDVFQVDHLIPLSRGGSNAPENLVISCAFCNQSKNDRLPQEWNGRLL